MLPTPLLDLCAIQLTVVRDDKAKGQAPANRFRILTLLRIAGIVAVAFLIIRCVVFVGLSPYAVKSDNPATG